MSTGTGMSVRSYFSKSEDLQEVIMNELNAAKSHIRVAVAWFTDIELFETLVGQMHNGVKVDLVITRHQFNDQSMNNYDTVNQLGGIFAEIGGDESYMHHKFCIIDDSVVLNGSFNWTKKARKSNDENLTVIKNDVLTIREFTREFDRLLEIAGYSVDHNPLSIIELLDYFKLVEACIALKRDDDIQRAADEIERFEDCKSIANDLRQKHYGDALAKMTELKSRLTGLMDINGIHKALLEAKLKVLQAMISNLEVELTECESLIERYNFRYAIVVYPKLLELLDFKKKIADKLRKKGADTTEFDAAYNEFSQTQQDYEEYQAAPIKDLSKEEQLDMNAAFREAARLSHPDSPDCVLKDKEKAGEILSELQQARKRNDIDRVRTILYELRNGGDPTANAAQSIEQLSAMIRDLEIKRSELITKITKIRRSEEFKMAQDPDRWDAQFEMMTEEIERELEKLKSTYAKKQDDV